MSISQLRSAVARTSTVIDAIRKRVDGHQHIDPLLRAAEMKTRRIIANISFLTPPYELDGQVTSNLRHILDEFSSVNQALKRILDHIEYEQAIMNIAERLLNVVHIHYTIPPNGVFHLFCGVACYKQVSFERAARHLIVAVRAGVVHARYYLRLIHLHHREITGLFPDTPKLVAHSKLDELTLLRDDVQVRSVQELNNP